MKLLLGHSAAMRLLSVIFVIALTDVDATIRFLQLSDFHVDVDYSINGDPTKACHKVEGARSNHRCVNEDASSSSLSSSPLHKQQKQQQHGAASRRLGRFGDYCCDSPPTLVDNAVQAAAAQLRRPDLLLWSGDNVPHISGYDEDYVIRALTLTTNAIRREFGDDVRVLPTYGNHDHAPSDQHGENDIQYAKTFELWKHWIGEDARDTFLRGGYYSATAVGQLWLVCNTNLLYQFDNSTAARSDDPAGQFAWMRDQLAKAKSVGTRVNIMAHIAPGAYERKAKFYWFYDNHNKNFLSIIREYASQIDLMIFGHHHTDTLHIIRDASGRAIQVAYMSPAVTPWYSGLGLGANNPAFRIYELNNYIELRDIKTYYVDLNALNADEETPWQLEYSFKEAYDVKDFSPTTIDAFVNRLESNSTLFDLYYEHNGVRSDLTRATAEMKHAQLCSLKHADYVQYDRCIVTSGNGHQVTSRSLFTFALSLFYAFYAV